MLAGDFTYEWDDDDCFGLSGQAIVRGWHRAMENSMPGLEFERFCCDFLCAIGFWRADATKGSGDDGVDVVATRDGLEYVVQCKRYSGPVGPGVIREAAGSRDRYRAMGHACDRTAVMTNSSFTRAAVETAASLGVLLWDGDWIESVAGEMDILLL